MYVIQLIIEDLFQSQDKIEHFSYNEESQVSVKVLQLSSVLLYWGTEIIEFVQIALCPLVKGAYLCHVNLSS